MGEVTSASFGSSGNGGRGKKHVVQQKCRQDGEVGCLPCFLLGRRFVLVRNGGFGGGGRWDDVTPRGADLGEKPDIGLIDELYG